MYKTIPLIFLLFFLNSCRNEILRTDYEELNGIEYGVILSEHKMLTISIKNIHKMNREEITNFCYCLMKQTTNVERIWIHSHFYYVGYGDYSPPRKNRKLFYINFDPLTYAKTAKIQDFRNGASKVFDTINFLEIPVNCQ